MQLSLLFGSVLAALVAAESAFAADVKTAPDGSWMSVTGTVAATQMGVFTLDYGEGLVTVEMDDAGWYDEAAPINAGQRVTVYGRIDDDLYEKRTIEASSVYVFGQNTYYYASARDEEDVTPYHAAAVAVIPEGTWLNVSGTVTKIDGREFMLDTGTGKIQVDTKTMSYNPLDDIGLHRIDVGDRVWVSGPLDLDFFEQREIAASLITSLRRGSPGEAKAADASS